MHIFFNSGNGRCRDVAVKAFRRDNIHSLHIDDTVEVGVHPDPVGLIRSY